jgi:glycosyltransferase involved in cell wall biosynthesis
LSVPASRISLLPNGADHLDIVQPDDSVLVRHGLRTGGYLLAVGSRNPNKNVRALLDAFTRLPADSNLKLVIVGGSNRQVFADSAFDYPQGALHIGYQDDGALKSLYRHAVALVFPSLYEGFGLPPLEAMACGCPVAASSTAAIPEVCGDAVLYFDPHSIDSIAQALQRLLDDTDLREQLRQAGSRRASTFRWSESARILRACVASHESNG